MKRKLRIFISVFSAIAVLLLFAPFAALAQEELNEAEYRSVLDSFDLSSFEELDSESRRMLDELGLSDFDYNSIVELSVSDFLLAVKDVMASGLKAPLASAGAVLIIILLSSLFQGFKQTLGSYQISSALSTVSAVLVSLLLISGLKETLAASSAAISVSADFVYAFVPAFCIIVAASGNTLAAFSTNTLLLSLAQALNFISKNIFIPLSNCFLALGICSGIRNELDLGALVENCKKYLITAVSVAATAFVSILSIKTAVASRADAIGLRSVRFAINSVVPVIGGAISEGLLSIQAYSSLIKSSVGVAGIAAVALVFLPAIIEVAFWRLFLNICSVVSQIFSDRSVTCVLKAFSDSLLVMNVILILSMVTTVISIGILIAARGSA